MPTSERWLLTLASQDTNSGNAANAQDCNRERRSSGFDSQTLLTTHSDWKKDLDQGEESKANFLSEYIPPDGENEIGDMKNGGMEKLDVYSQKTAQDAIDTSGCWSIGEFSQDEEDMAPQDTNFRGQALFSQIANSRDEIDDNSSYSSILGDLSPRLSPDDFDDIDNEYHDLEADGDSKEHETKSKHKLIDLETSVTGSDAGSISKKNIPANFTIATPSNFTTKAPVYVSSKTPAFSVLSANTSVKSETSKRKHNQITSGSYGNIELVENGLSMKAKKLLDADQHIHNQWDTDVRGYMAQLGSVAFLGPIYPNTQLFRIVHMMEDRGLVYTECIRVTEPPEEVVWSHVSAAENQSQDDNQAAWSPAENDDIDARPQVIYFSFVNFSLSQVMRARFNQSRLVRIWPPWHEHLLELDDGSVTTIKLVTQFITDAIY